MFLLSFAQPSARGIILAAPQSSAAGLQKVLDGAEPGGFHVQGYRDSSAAARAVTTGDVAGAFVSGGSGSSELLVSSAASSTRAEFLEGFFGRDVAQRLDTTITVRDVVPVAAGDVSGAGLFFYAMPLLLVGLITSIVLLQLGGWRLRNKLVLIAGAGAFASLFCYFFATARDVIPSSPPLLLYGFVLTQAVGWLTTAVAMLFKRVFMPIAMTFVLILGVPTSGGTVNSDMLPAFMGWLNGILPFAQFIDITRSSAYFDGHGIAQPLMILLAWAFAGAALVAFAARRKAKG
ncbi:hypothetical protein ACFCV8_23480 [Streptomyces sp. NPDC056347]|uniref:hypothetical protein n=1 Tax=Streptomyces sp. NPDC056347 TaxID=3345790 RepID=UPI0035DF01D9